jgi:hypothetical protein
MKKRTVLTMATVAMVVTLLLAQAVSVSGAAPPAVAKWTFMVYIVGDNDLDAYVPLDIETELAPTGSNADVSVVALADRAATAEWTQTLLFYVTQGMSATPENAVADWGEANMGDPQTLVDFVQWTKANYPAENYALSLWNHGWSWRPYQSMWDETDDDTLDQHELEAVLAEVGPIDVIMYDACQMATIENQATVRNYSQAIVHSQEFVGWDGIEYELVIPALQANPGMTAEQLAVEINQSSATNKEKTGSAVALNTDWDALITAIDEWAVALQGGLPTYKSVYVNAFRAAQSFVGDKTAKDLYDIAYEINNRVSDSNIQAKSQAVMSAVDAVVLDEWHSRPYSGAHGISIFLPATVGDLDDLSTTEWNEWDYYRNYLAFSRLTNWDEFLDAYINGQ